MSVARSAMQGAREHTLLYTGDRPFPSIFCFGLKPLGAEQRHFDFTPGLVLRQGKRPKPTVKVSYEEEKQNRLGNGLYRLQCKVKCVPLFFAWRFAVAQTIATPLNNWVLNLPAILDIKSKQQWMKQKGT